MDYYSYIKGREILPFVRTWVDPESIMLSEVRMLCDPTYVWNLKKKKSRLKTKPKKKKKSQTHRKRDQICGYQRQGTGGSGLG